MKLIGIIFLSNLMVFGKSYSQNVDSLITEINIKSEYFEKYKHFFEIDTINLSNEVKNEPFDEVRKTNFITIYKDSLNQIGLVEFIELSEHMTEGKTIKKYYLNNNMVYFIHIIRSFTEWGGYNSKNRITEIEEDKIYIKLNSCILYLNKSVSGDVSEIKSLFREKNYNTKDCKYSLIYMLDYKSLTKIINEAK